MTAAGRSKPHRLYADRDYNHDKYRRLVRTTASPAAASNTARAASAN